jgi:nucleotide-binding universal stress UspA family protein
MAWARDAAARCGASLELLTVVDSTKAETNGHVAEAEAYLRSQIERMQANGVDITSSVAVGVPGEQIVSHASEAGLTVMTYHTSRWLFGGALDMLLKGMVNPVVVVRAQDGQPAHPFEVSKILAPIGNTARSTAAIPYAVDLCRAWSAQLVLCNVVSPIPGAYDKRNPPREIAEAIEEQIVLGEQMVLSIAMELTKQGITAESVIRVGEPAREIIAAAREAGAGLITMSTRGADSMSRILASVAMGVVQASPIPCLLIRPPVAEKA